MILKLSWCIFGIIASTTQIRDLDKRLAFCNGHDIRELTIQKAHDLYQNGGLTSLKLTECYLERIKYMNPHLYAIIEVNPDAYEIANNLDEYFKGSKKFKGNLHGIPILIKDNIGTFDKMNTTAGAWAMLGVKPKEDAEVVKKLRKAGAIIMGKANLSEWAGLRSLKGHMGWSGRGGFTNNPYVFSETPAGSSSGSAAAVASNLALVSLGSETDGSIMAPSEVCSVVGLKPSVGLTSGQGVIPVAPSLDSVGPIARTVKDIIEVIYAISEPKLKEKIESIRKTSESKKIIKLGILENYFTDENLPQDQKVAIENLVQLVSSKIKFKYFQANFSSIDSSKTLMVMKSEFKHYINQYLTHHVIPKEKNPRTLQDIIDFNYHFHKTDLFFNNQELLIEAQKAPNIDSPKYLNILEQNKIAAQTAIDDLILNNQVDILMAPSRFQLEKAVYSPPAVAGYPIINLPIGIHQTGVPFGMTLIGPYGSEATLLEMSLILEKHFSRPTPNFLPTFLSKP